MGGSPHYSLLICVAASVVRHIYLRPGVGVGGLRKVYGGECSGVGEEGV